MCGTLPFKRYHAHLRLPMNQDINIEFLLELDNFVDFLLDGLNIFLLRNPIQNSTVILVSVHRQAYIFKENMRIDSLLGLVFTAHPSQFNSLGERANGRSWEDWKIELLLLSIKSGTYIS